ncbi:MAG: hypothetical protein IBJ11_11820 [Phycisphaerales bacterium]|nr:hypothetical protein [Phycisphaerales bacterium]
MVQPSRGPWNPPTPRLYEEEGDQLMAATQRHEHCTLLPEAPAAAEKAGRIRILWGQQMVPDLVAGRYRAVVCSVNAVDNADGVISQLVRLTQTSQWTPATVTSYAKMFSESVNIHAANDREPYILKYDLDSLLILALLRPSGRDFFTLDDLSRGFATVTKMLAGRRERLPVASVSFLGARSNRLYEDASSRREPSFEAVLRTMYASGFRGDVYPSPQMWALGHIGVFPSYPFPEALDVMREGGH